MDLFFLLMVSILLCNSLPTENCFKAELEHTLLVVDENADFQSQIAVELGTPFPKKYLYSLIYNDLDRRDPDKPFHRSVVACK